MGAHAYFTLETPFIKCKSATVKDYCHIGSEEEWAWKGRHTGSEEEWAWKGRHTGSEEEWAWKGRHTGSEEEWAWKGRHTGSEEEWAWKGRHTGSEEEWAWKGCHRESGVVRLQQNKSKLGWRVQILESKPRAYLVMISRARQIQIRQMK